MKVEVISIGDELLLGQTINTNAAWLGKQLSLIGSEVIRVNTISDTKESILASLNEVSDEASCVILTGGLGPTKDDITKQVLSEFFDSKLVLHDLTLEKVTSFFKARDAQMLDVNTHQAYVPSTCDVLDNNYGTAPGMWFDKDDMVYISLPGVPYEMKGIFTDEIVSRIKERFNLSSIYHKTLLTQGIGESFLAEKLVDWETNIRNKGFGLAYLPSPGIVKLRITSKNGIKDKDQINGFFKEIEERFPEAFFAYGELSLPEVTGNLLKKQKKTLGTVESCTAGMLASQISSIPGASAYYEGALLTYSYKIKTSLANVPADLIQKEGAVSEPVAIQMAENGRDILGADICCNRCGLFFLNSSSFNQTG